MAEPRGAVHDAATLLPGDDSSGSFDNIANALSVSPALLQAFRDQRADVALLVPL
mgnify:CR=1 FL=1